MHVDGVPKNHRVDDQAKCSKLVFLTFAIAFTDFTSLAVISYPSQAISTLAPIKLSENPTAICFLVDVIQLIERL